MMLTYEHPVVRRWCMSFAHLSAERVGAMRRASFGIFGAALLILSLITYEARAVEGASGFADPAFQTQWSAGEAITPNFWGPITTAKDGQQEPYAEATSGQRLVQYFDKGRMELTKGVVTNGLLASEIVKGQVQTGDASFQQKAAPAIPIAGDNDNPGPTYAHLGTSAKALLANTPSQQGGSGAATVGADGTMTPGNATLSGRATLLAYDLATQHNVPGVFADYRDKAGLKTIGFAISEPFGANVKVAGQQKGVLIQVFERRVLTYTPDNDPAFQVEMGNIGQHYFQWRYTGAPVAGGGSLSASASPPTSGSPSPTTDPSILLGSPPLPPPFQTIPHKPVTLPSGLPPLDSSSIVPPTNLTCASFHSQAAAQEFLRLFPNDPSRLDPGRTGIACPNNPAPTDKNPVARS